MPPIPIPWRAPPCSAANAGFLGAFLRDLVVPGMEFAVVINFMIDADWLLSACPALLDCPRLILVHGETGHR